MVVVLGSFTGTIMKPKPTTTTEQWQSERCYDFDGGPTPTHLAAAYESRERNFETRRPDLLLKSSDI